MVTTFSQSPHGRIRLVIDVTAVGVAPCGGIGVYTMRLARALSRSSWKNQVAFIALDPLAHDVDQYLPGIPIHKVRLAKHLKGFFRDLWGGTYLALYCKRRFPNAILHLTNVCYPLFQPAHTVITIHDTIVALFPNKYSTWRSHLASSILHHIHVRAARKATLVLAASQRTKLDTQTIFKVSKEKIQVLGCFIEKNYASSPATVNLLPDLRSPFWLYSGGYVQRKNVEFMLECYEAALLRQKLPKLVMTGNFPESYTSGKRARLKELVDRIHKQFPASIHNIGIVSEQELQRLYLTADLVLYPSLYEGFGIPLIEAAAANTPVLCSKRSCLPEVVDNPASLFDPEDNDELIQKMITAAMDPHQFHISLPNSCIESNVVRRYQQLISKAFPNLMLLEIEPITVGNTP